MDLNMLALFGGGSGRVRTLSEFRDLLAAAGFEMIAVIPTSGSVRLIESETSPYTAPPPSSSYDNNSATPPP
jgi:hypothetical protein